MRIVHTCLRYPPATGGVETYVREIVERTLLRPSGSEGQASPVTEVRDVRVLTSKLRTHGPISELNPDLLLDDPMYVQRLHHAKTPLVSYPRLQALTHYIGHHRPDILHGYSFWYQPADTAARYATAHNIPFILHPMYYENDIRRKAVWQLYRRSVGKRTFAAADVVVVISPHEQSLIEQADLPVSRFELIPPGVDTTRFGHPRISPFIKRGIKGRVLLSVSRLAAGKGLDDLIAVMPEILKAHPDTQLAIVGEDFGAEADLKRQTQQLGLDDHIYFLGKLDEVELAAAYQHATVFVHPSHYEAFGIVLAESLAAGTPVVARNVAAVPFVVPDKKAGILFNTQQELSNAIIQLIGSEARRKELGLFGQQHVAEQFSWDTNIQKLLELYAELIP